MIQTCAKISTETNVLIGTSSFKVKNLVPNFLYFEYFSVSLPPTITGIVISRLIQITYNSYFCSLHINKFS